MGKRIMNRRRGRGFRYRATDNRFKGKVRHPRAKSSSGVVQKLLHDPGRSAPVAQVRDGDLVLIDAGCELDCYASDITRTFPASGTFSPEQRAIYDIVLAAQEAAMAVIGPGHSWNFF